MDKFSLLLGFALMLTVVSGQHRPEGQCFRFPGDGYLHFIPNHFTNSDNIKYRLQFRTGEAHGILMHCRGLEGDDETLYVRDGKLHYHLFNTSPHGIDNFFGGHFVSTEMVNTTEWVTVDVYRMFRTQSSRRDRSKTGFSFSIGESGETHEYVDFRNREDIELSETLYFGGYRSPLSSTVGNFKGDIRDISVQTAGREIMLEEPSLNYGGRVEMNCEDFIIDAPDPQ